MLYKYIVLIGSTKQNNITHFLLMDKQKFPFVFSG